MVFETTGGKMHLDDIRFFPQKTDSNIDALKGTSFKLTTLSKPGEIQFSFQSTANGQGSLEIVAVNGIRIYGNNNIEILSGENTFSWKYAGQNTPHGIYVYTFRTQSGIYTEKIIL